MFCRHNLPNTSPLPFPARPKNLPKPKQKIKVKTFGCQNCQTEISLLQNPDLFECERMFNIRPNLDKLESGPSPAALDEQRVKRLGLDLHRSHSDMFIAYADTYLHRERDADPPKSSVDRWSRDVPCSDCARQKRKCAGCMLRKLMRQHITGKLKIEDLKSTLTRICLNSDPEYKRTMIAALENFKGSLHERTRGAAAGSRIQNFIEAVSADARPAQTFSKEIAELWRSKYLGPQQQQVLDRKVDVEWQCDGCTNLGRVLLHVWKTGESRAILFMPGNI